MPLPQLLVVCWRLTFRILSLQFIILISASSSLHSILCVCVSVYVCVCVCVSLCLCPNFFLSLGHILIEFQLIPVTTSELNHLQRLNFHIRSHSQTKGLGLKQLFWGNERVTGRKARGLQMEEIDCKCQTFFSSLLMVGGNKLVLHFPPFSIQI